MDADAQTTKTKVAGYRGSVMYKIPQEWMVFDDGVTLHPLMRLDYRQLSIMFLTLLNNEEYQEKMAPYNLDQSHTFLQKLYNGEFDKHQFDLFLDLYLNL